MGLPSEILPTESRIYSLKPTIKKKLINDKKKKVKFIKKEEDWNWEGETINIYSFKQLKDDEINFGSSFIEYFKVYKSLFKIQNLSTKIKRIKILLKWLRSNKNFLLLYNNDNFLILDYFNLLLRTITKYKIFKKRIDKNSNQNEFKEFKQVKKLYDRVYRKSEKLINLTTNIELIIFLVRDLDNFTPLTNFNFLKLNIVPKLNVIINNYKVQSNLYFTNSFKELVKFKYNVTKKDKERSQSQVKIFKNKTKYLKTKSKIIQYKD